MPVYRKRLLTAVFLLFVAAHAVAVITRHHHWPVVVNSATWATTMEPTFECFVPYAVPEQANLAEFRLPGVGVPTIWLVYAFRKLHAYPHRSRGYERARADCAAQDDDDRRRCTSDRLLEQLLEFLHERYAVTAAEQTSAQDKAAMPPLRAVKLYEVRYQRLAGGGHRIVSQKLRAEWKVGR